MNNSIKSISDLKEIIQEFWSLDDEKEKQVIAAVKKLATTTDKSQFIKEVRENFKQSYYSGIGVIYMILAEELTGWEDFFIEEYKRVFRQAKSSDTPYNVLYSLTEICLTEDKSKKFIEEIVRIITSNLAHRNPIIRYAAIELLDDWVDEQYLAQNKSLLSKLQKHLYDEHWKVRTITAKVLKYHDSLPKNFKLSLIDRIRAKISDSYYTISFQ